MRVTSIRRLALLAVCCILLVLCGAASAESALAPDISAQCTITASYNTESIPLMLTDDLMTFWEAPINTSRGMRPFVQVDTPADAPAYGLYIVWTYEPDAWQVMIPNPEWAKYEYLGDDDPQSKPRWVTAATGGANNYVHEYIPLDGLTSFRIQPQHIKEHPFSIVSLHVLGKGELPDWVQTWQPIPPRVDLMVISAHADDELLFFGGTLPTYAGERKLDTAVVYMTYCSRERRSELLNGLWACGVRSYPVIGDFLDVFTASPAQAAAICPEDDVEAFIVEQLRHYKPKVVVSHDLNGEYGHGMHSLTAASTLKAVVDLAWDESCFPESAAAYGTCDVDKLYLHLYPQGRVSMDWSVPMQAFGGKIALDVAQTAFEQHVSQRDFFKVYADGANSCREFGLASTMVGPDEAGNDFFEHVTLWRDEKGEGK